METSTYTWVAAAVALAVLGATRLQRRLELSAAKHPSLAGHPRLARRLAALLPRYEYDEAEYFRADGAPDEVAERRRAAFARLAALYAGRFAQSTALGREVEAGISDQQFTQRYRVPFQFRSLVMRHLKGAPYIVSSRGVRLTDLDGNEYLDVSGSYGVNLFGYDFYKLCIEDGAARVRELGPLLGAYHPIVADNVARLRRISGLDEVSFHMSGTEAVMQAVRLARYHTRRTHVVRFCGAYHGWWGDVQPGVGNPMPAESTYTLREMDERSLRVLRRRKDIACVLVNPLQALHPNASAPGDSTLVDSSRNAHFDRTAYTDWLQRLRSLCTERGIPLIFDEVFVGFRLAPGGAQEYFGVHADLVTYGKTLGGGLPVGVLCGRAQLMKRYREERPADICFARGTFNSHPYVMAAMNEFLRRLDSDPVVRRRYDDLDAVWNDRARRLNERLQEAGLPPRVSNLSSVWTVCYTRPSRYNWMLQFYLRAHGLALSWVGTGRLIFSLDYDDAEFDEFVARFVAAAREMEADGWWWQGAMLTNRAIRRRITRELLRVRFGRTPVSAAPVPACAGRAEGAEVPCGTASGRGTGQ